jgi:hypothetical protein
MYKSISIFLLVAFQFAQPNLGSDATLDIMTWNIEHFPKAAETIGYVADFIQASNLDVIALP